MNDTPWLDTEYLPSVQRLLSSIANCFDNGQSAILLLPPAMCPSDVGAWLHSALANREVSAERVDVAAWHAVPDSAQSLFNQALGIPVGRERSLEDLFGEPSFPTVFIITGVGHVAESGRTAWLKLIADWADETRRASQRQPRCVICLIEQASALPSTPPPDVHLALRYWWGLPSSLELRTHCRNLEGGDTALAAWRESMVAGVAPGDASLAAYLWTHCPKSLPELRDSLLEFAQQHTIVGSAEQPRDQHSQSRFACTRIADRPTDAQHGVWASGGIVGSPEYGEEQHPCRLATCPDQQQIEHLLWRGQQQVLLPLVDHVRIAGCHHVSAKRGNHWQKQYITEDTNHEDRLRLEQGPFGADFGPLCSELSSLPDGRGGSTVALFRQVKAVRNQLAHYRALDYATFETFWGAVRA
jgi:hypothetical protein